MSIESDADVQDLLTHIIQTEILAREDGIIRALELNKSSTSAQGKRFEEVVTELRQKLRNSKLASETKLAEFEIADQSIQWMYDDRSAGRLQHGQFGKLVCRKLPLSATNMALAISGDIQDGAYVQWFFGVP